MVMKINDETQTIEEVYFSSFTNFVFDFTAYSCDESQTYKIECDKYRIYGYGRGGNNNEPVPVAILGMVEFHSDFRVMQCGMWFRVHNFKSGSISFLGLVNGYVKDFAMFYTATSGAFGSAVFEDQEKTHIWKQESGLG